jgi:hypothetical protein
VLDAGENSDNEEESVIVSDQDDDSNSAGTSVFTDMYVLLRHG